MLGTVLLPSRFPRLEDQSLLLRSNTPLGLHFDKNPQVICQIYFRVVRVQFPGCGLAEVPAPIVRTRTVPYSPPPFLGGFPRISGRSSFSPGIRRRQETRQSQVTICLYADFRESVRRRRAAPEVLQTHYSSPAQVLFFARGCEFTLGNSIGVCSDVPLVFSGRNHFFSAPSQGAEGPNSIFFST